MTVKEIHGLKEAMRALSFSAQSCKTLPARTGFSICRRSMATATPVPDITRSVSQPWPSTTVPLTIYSFPSLEPRSVESWSTKHLHLPLRRDILHLAVVYEGDRTRQGTASSKTRYEVAGSHRKLSPQKGTGRARRGDRQSPLLRGGGKTFGPKPRDFSTRLNRKVYDLAWRTALSYRYRRGELIVSEDGLDLPLPDDFLQLAEAGRLGRVLEDGFVRRYLRQMMGTLRWGAEHGRSTFITTERRPNLFTGFEVAGQEGRALEVDDVDVKDLLETGRLVIERSALREMIQQHQSDLVSRVFINGVRVQGPPLGTPILT
ncbi:hypothetical protein VTK73DRAFT_1618 [Phialemonium thermophilum]|uniref:Large ribosomal subunit protein uL4m n=1 Tax=Phialemonium thermophilum TaxID=223376 RepID=A0ABR3X9K9_9PEZI